MQEIIDLTLAYTDDTVGYKKEVAKTVAKDGWNASTLTFYSHCGTHMDAPIHFGVSDQSIDQLPVTNFIGEAWIANIEHVGDHGTIDESDVPILDKLNPGDSLILKTGWSAFAGTKKYRDELPRISEKLAHRCVALRLKMLVVEPPSVADVNNIDEVTLIHQILLGGGVTIVEGVANLEKIEKEKVTLIALPLKIEGGDGSPARVIAIQDS